MEKVVVRKVVARHQIIPVGTELVEVVDIGIFLTVRHKLVGVTVDRSELPLDKES